MEPTVELQTRARFGKRGGASDYCWLMAPSSLPPGIFSVCELFVQAAESSNAFISLVAEEQNAVWLIRVYHQGFDNSYRAIVGLEVAEVISPSSLPRKHWLGLAAIGIQTSERERIGVANAFAINLAPLRLDSFLPDAALMARTRLGLPIATSPQAAFYLLDQPFLRHRGTCYAVSGKSNPALEWSDALAPYICVNVSEPPLSAEDEALVAAVLRHAPSQAEWLILDNLEIERVRKALLWSVSAMTPAPIISDADPLKQWVFLFRSSQYEGADLLSTLRRDFGSYSLSPDFISQATKGLSAEASSFVAALMRCEKPEMRTEVLEELVQQGYTKDMTLMPLALWATHVKQSRLLAEQAINILVISGSNADAARFILDLGAPTEGSMLCLPEGLGVATRIAYKKGLPLPRRRFLCALNSVSINQLRQIEEIGDIYGGWAGAMSRLILEGTLPPSGVLNAKELAASIATRIRTVSEPLALFEAISSLMEQDRLEEARTLLNNFHESRTLQLNPVGLRVVASRLGISSPDRSPPVEELNVLVEMGLARPEDVVFEPGDALDIASYARLWPSTRSLATIVEGVEAPFPSMVIPPEIPESWRPAVREALTPHRVARWFQNLDSKSRHSARNWFVQFHPVHPSALDVLCGTANLPIDKQEIRAILPWLGVLIGAEPYSARLTGFVNIARAGIAIDDEAFAVSLIDALLPELNEKAQDFAVYVLCRVGLPPLLAGLSHDLVVVSVPVIDPLCLIDAMITSEDSSLSSDDEIIQAVVESLRRADAPYPAHGYRKSQIRRHVELASALAHVKGWECLSPDQATRVQYALCLLQRIGLSPNSLIAFLQNKAEQEIRTSVEIKE